MGKIHGTRRYTNALRAATGRVVAPLVASRPFPPAWMVCLKIRAFCPAPRQEWGSIEGTQQTNCRPLGWKVCAIRPAK